MTSDFATAALPTPLLIDAKTACNVLSLSPRYLWTLTARGAIPSKRIGRSLRYSPAELQSWVDAGCPTAPKSGGVS